MRAVAITAPGPPDVLQLVERPDPVPAAGEVLIAVEAAGVNRPDVLQRLGKYAPPPGVSDLPGLEVAGRVVAVGPPPPGAGQRWQVGDAVCALVAGGGEVGDVFGVAAGAGGGGVTGQRVAAINRTARGHPYQEDCMAQPHGQNQ